MSSMRAGQEDRLRARFHRNGSARAISRGERLHDAGAALSHVYLIEKGWIGRSRCTQAGDAAFTGIYIVGDVVGADGILSEHLDDDLIALTNGSVFRSPTAAFRASESQDAEAAMALVGLLAADSGFLREALFSTGRQSSSERLSTFILQTFHRQVSASIITQDARAFDLPLSQSQLAAVTGVTTVHLNRTLQVLRAAGCVDVRDGVVRIHDLDALKREAVSASTGRKSRAPLSA